MKLFTIFALIFSIWSAQAAAEDFCDSVGTFARTIMEARQTGVAMSKLVELTKQHGMDEGGMPIIIAAYEAPRYSTEEYRQREIQDFENQAYLACGKGLQ